MARKARLARKVKRKSNSPAKRKAVGAAARPPRKASRRVTKSSKHDALDDFIIAAAQALMLPAEPQWLPAIKANLRVTLQHASAVAQFPLPDDAEPAPVFRA
jgi:hypothetical protein